jgi:hypothetical protein
VFHRGCLIINNIALFFKNKKKRTVFYRPRIFYLIRLSFAFCNESFSSSVSSYSDLKFFTGFAKMLTWFLEYILEIIIPSPSLFMREVAKLWFPPMPAPWKGLNLTVSFPETVLASFLSINWNLFVEFSEYFFK